MRDMNTKRVILHVRAIRQHPNGRSEQINRKVLDLLRSFLKDHPHAKEIREAIETIERELAEETRRRKATFGEYAQRWLATRRDAGENVALVGALLRQRIEPEFGDRRLDAITPAQVKRWVETRRRESRSFEIERDLLRSILVAAAAEGVIEQVPGEHHLR